MSLSYEQTDPALVVGLVFICVLAASAMVKIQGGSNQESNTMSIKPGAPFYAVLDAEGAVVDGDWISQLEDGCQALIDEHGTRVGAGPYEINRYELVEAETMLEVRVALEVAHSELMNRTDVAQKTLSLVETVLEKVRQEPEK